MQNTSKKKKKKNNIRQETGMLVDPNKKFARRKYYPVSHAA